MKILFLLAATVFFPSVPEIWQTGPLTDETAQVPASETFAPAAQLKDQLRLFRQLASPAQRSRMALEFAKTCNPAAFPMLIRLLREEKNSFVRDNLFQALYQLKTAGYAAAGKECGVFPEYFNAPSPIARGTAMYLYLTAAENPDPSKVMEAVRNESSLFVLDRIAQPLFARAGEISRSLAGNLYLQADAANLGLRSLAGELIARQGNPDDSEILRKALQTAHPSVRARIARGLAGNPASAAKLLAEAAKDPYPGVRLAAASVSRPDAARVPILKTLLNDPVPAVRAAAAESLGNASVSAAAEALAEKLDDPEIMVRRKAAGALIRLKPPAEIHQKAVEIAEVNPLARRQVLDFLVQTGDRNYCASILDWIGQSQDLAFLREAAAALGKLKCATAGAVLIRLAGSKDAEVRRAAAQSMGMLEIPQTYPILVKLCRDRNNRVAEAAFMSMYQIGHASFVPEFERMTGKLTEDGANCRAIACRALAGCPLKAEVIARLNKLITRNCIVVPMAAPMPDANHVRISALMLLLEHAKKGNSAAREAYRKDLRFLDGLKPDSELRNADFDEFLRQLKEYEAGRKVKPKTIEPNRPVFSAEPARDRQ